MDVGIAGGVYDEKIKKVLKKLLDPQFKLKDDASLNLLLSHIRKYQEKGQNHGYLTNTFSCWIIVATKKWETSKESVAPDIFAFTLNLVSFISEDETRFVKFNSLNLYERLMTVKEDIHSTSPIIKLGFITLISSFLKHKSGLQWVMATNYWSNIISITLEVHTIYITSAGHKFIANLLDKTFSLNKTYCQNVIKSILDPLDKVTAQTPLKTLFQILTLTKDILTLLLQRTNMDLLDLFINGFKLNNKLRTCLLLSQTEEFEFEIRSIILLIDIVEDLKVFSGSEKVNYTLIEEARKKRRQEIFQELIKKGYPRSVIKLCYNGFILWGSIKDKMPKFIHRDQQIELENQLAIMQLIPIVAAGVKWLGHRNIAILLNADPLRDSLVNKVLKVTCTRTVQIGYIWRNYLLDHNTLEISTTSLIYVLKSKHFYTRTGGIFGFQTFIYCLKDIIDHIKAGPDNILLKSQESKFLETLLEAIGVFIGEFNITWKDSIECMCVMALAVELFHFTIWTPQVVIKALRLLNITLNNFLAPSTTLLFDTVYDANLKSLGSLLYAKCHDPSWEVKDSALEVLCTMSYNANNSFPFFKKIVLDADLPRFVLDMASKDKEPFVRASALRCLQEMVQVLEFWNVLKKIDCIHEIFFNIMSIETEGIVRKEATTLICKIYDNQHYHQSMFSKLYDVMTHAAIADLHWEVRVNALKFWKSVINNYLQHQGMIDGTFPEVTFSKEHRKIVNLNHAEVKKRLVKVLNQLSEIGCLAVFIAAIQDECDIEVSRSAIANVSEFVNLLKRYEINAQNFDLSSSPLNSMVPGEFFKDDILRSAVLNAELVSSPLFSNNLFENCSVNNIDNNVYSSSSSSSFEISQSIILSVRSADITDDILDEILNSTDINVLTSLNSPIDGSSNSTVPLRKKTIVPPSDFINFTYNNLESSLSEKNKWLNSLDDFGSLLDDILSDYELPEIINLD